MRKMMISLIVFLFVTSLFPVFAAVQSDKNLLQDAKLLLFDKKWSAAQEKLEQLLEDFPDSELYSQAFFYKGKCLFEQPGKEAQALKVYKDYLELEDKNRNLVQDSEWAIIELSFRLYENGKRSYLRDIETRLRSRDRSVRYFAALKLSYAADKEVAGKGLPVLEEILEEEGDDEELSNRAKLAILRIDPDAFENLEEQKFTIKVSTLYIRAENKRTGKTTLSLNIPWALADLALQAIPVKEKEMIRKEGYDLDGIIKRLIRLKGEILEFEDEDSIIKIWLK